MEQRQVGRTGLMIETLGLGGAPLGGNFATLDYSQAAELIQAAKDADVGYFDTAPWYGFGRSERVMGDLLRGSDYVLSDKVGRLLKPGPVENPMDFGMIEPLPFNVVYDYSYDGIMRAFEDSLQRLGLDRIDILLAHDIGVFQHGEDNKRHFKNLAEGGYRAMDELRKTGLVKAIGLGVNENQVCEDALGIGDWDVFLLAGRYTLFGADALGYSLPGLPCSKHHDHLWRAFQLGHSRWTRDVELRQSPGRNRRQSSCPRRGGGRIQHSAGGRCASVPAWK